MTRAREKCLRALLVCAVRWSIFAGMDTGSGSRDVPVFILPIRVDQIFEDGQRGL